VEVEILGSISRQREVCGGDNDTCGWPLFRYCRMRPFL